jgi:hypothetical protein
MAETRSTEGVCLFKIWTTDSVTDSRDFMKPRSNVGHQFWDGRSRSKWQKGILSFYSTPQIYPWTVEDSPWPAAALGALPRRRHGRRSLSVAATGFGEGIAMRFGLEQGGGIKDPYRGLLGVGEAA